MTQFCGRKKTDFVEPQGFRFRFVEPDKFFRNYFLPLELRSVLNI